MSDNVKWFKKGLKDGIPIALGYFAVSFTLGIPAKEAGINPFQAGVMSMVMLASAGEFAAINVIATAESLIQMIITTLIVNLRYLLMSSSMSQKLGSDTKWWHRLFLPCFVTDEIFGIASAVPGKLNPFYNYGAAALSVPGWTIGTILGTAVGAILPDRVENALGVALYGMFLAIIIPGTKKSKFMAALIVISMGSSYLLGVLPVVSKISSSMRIIILTIAIAAIAAIIRPVDDFGNPIKADISIEEGENGN